MNPEVRCSIGAPIYFFRHATEAVVADCNVAGRLPCRAGDFSAARGRLRAEHAAVEGAEP